MPTNTTVESTGAKQVRVLVSGNDKTQITAMLACTADGNELTPFVVFKGAMKAEYKVLLFKRFRVL